MNYIDATFDAKGPLARHLEGYQPRAGQVAMAHAVERSLRERRDLLVEAPTGIGKSIAYGVPAAYWGSQSNKDDDTPRERVLIVTANIALQEQLVTKDLPFLADVLPVDFSFALCKGKSNYLCTEAYEEAKSEGSLIQLGHQEDPKLQALLDWAAETASGDKSELPFEPPYAMWSLVSTTADDCDGSLCSHYEEGSCFWKAAKLAAVDADILVCNYHLLYAHLMVQRATGGEHGVLPHFIYIIMDEAHRAADIAREAFGVRFTAASVGRLGSHLLSLGQGRMRQRLVDEADGFFKALYAHHESLDYKVRLRTPYVVHTDSLFAVLHEVHSVYDMAAASITVVTKEDAKRRSRLKTLRDRCRTVEAGIGDLMALCDENLVSYIEGTKGTAALRGKPIVVADILHDLIFSKKTCVLTSATMTSAGSFDFVMQESGVDAGADTLTVESPFNYMEQCQLVVHSSMPEPNDPGYPVAVADSVAEIIKLADGRVLGLFTSYRNLNAAYARVQDIGYRVLRQGDMPRTKLVMEFRKDVRSVLLGTESFWSGVDIPGEALSCVVIDRLPFPSPGDPVVDVLSARDKWGTFHGYSIPRAIIAFRQGCGRLIRRTTDRGVIVVLDRRLTSKPYGTKFRNSLPFMVTTMSLDAVGHFLGTLEQPKLVVGPPPMPPR